MDELDVKLCLHLITNSRLTFRELGERVNLSVNAVHKRVKDLIESGVIGKFSAHPSMYILNAVHIVIFGETEQPLNDKDTNKLGQNTNTMYVLSASGNNLYLGALLPTIHDLDQYVQFTKQTARMVKPQVGIISGSYFAYGPSTYSLNSHDYDRIDWQIIHTLHNDARKSLSEVASEVGTSVQTVRRHLNEMMENNAIQLTIDWRPDNSNDVITFLHIALRPHANRDSYTKSILKHLSPHFFLIWIFNNIPDLVIGWAWTKNMKELQDMIQQLQDTEVESIVPYILYEGHTFDTWRDSLHVKD
jgi:DNA-binding Lrp family transcriptional regulator